MSIFKGLLTADRELRTNRSFGLRPQDMGLTGFDSG